MSGRGIPSKTSGEQTKMECFFQKSIRAGRPRRKKSKGARPKKRSERLHQAMVKEKIDRATEVEDLLARSRVKETRASTSNPNTRALLAATVDEWDSLSQPQRSLIQKKKWVQIYARKIGVSESCLRSYIHEDRDKRRLVLLEGQKSRRGKPSLMVPETRRAVQDTIASADLGNQGMTVSAVVEAVQNSVSGITKKQASNLWFRTLRPEGNANGVLTKHPVKAQQTTSMRSMVTVRQQRRFYNAFSACQALQASDNLPCGTFKKVQASFVANYDEECFQGRGNEVKIVGAAEIRKHEAITAGRTTISTLKCGLADGQTGPFIFILEGKEIRHGFEDNQLVEHYMLPEGSTVVMTASGFMTDDAFNIVAPKLAKGLRALKNVQDHPDWWMILTGDGFHSHKFTIDAQVALRRAKIIHLIEEGDSSQINQPFDRYAARHSKATAREVLPLVIRHKVFGTTEHLDQWQLLTIAAHCVRELIKDPDIWTRSFIATNLHPDYRLSFDAWIQKISDFITRGGSYEDEGEITPASLLPDWYRNWPPERKRVAKALIDKHGWDNASVLRTLCKKTCMPENDLPAYQTVYFVESDRGQDACTEPPIQTISNKIVVDPNRSLLTFQLHPAGVTGKDLFEHMCRFRSRRMNPPQRKYSWECDWLDLEIKPDQLQVIQPTEADLSVGQLLRDCAASTGSRRMPKRKLNVLGEINAYSVLANDPDRIKRMKSVGELAMTVDKMREEATADKVIASAARDKELKEKHLERGLNCLTNERVINYDSVIKLKVKQMEAILLDRLGTRIKVGTKKAEVADLLVKKAKELNWVFPSVADEPN